MKPLVIHHANCADGWTAAWICSRALGDVELRPAQYGEPPPIEEAHGRDVYVLDFSYDLAATHALADAAESLLVLDHHRSAAKALGLQQALESPHRSWMWISSGGQVFIDLNHSGARLAWEWFGPDDEPPRLVEYVEDRDLWRWELERSDAINAAIGSYIHTIPTWDVLADRLQRRFHEVALEGAGILRYQERLLERLAENAHTVVIDGHEVRAVNSPVLQSELGHKLAVGHDFSAIYYDTNREGIVSLRSDAGGIAVNEVAEKFGGGGHPGAAGFPCERFWSAIEGFQSRTVEPPKGGK